MIFSLRSRCRSCFFHCRRSFEVCGFFYSINLPFSVVGSFKRGGMLCREVVAFDSHGG